VAAVASRPAASREEIKVFMSDSENML
jgi:hypothetical protein